MYCLRRLQLVDWFRFPLIIAFYTKVAHAPRSRSCCWRRCCAAAGVALLRIVGPKQNREQQQVLGIGFRVSMTSKSCLGFFSDFCCILRIPRRLPSWISPKRKELTAIRCLYFIVLLLQSFPLRNVCRQKRGAIINVVYVENSYDQISALCLPMWAVNDQIFIHLQFPLKR